MKPSDVKKKLKNSMIFGILITSFPLSSSLYIHDKSLPDYKNNQLCVKSSSPCLYSTHCAPSSCLTSLPRHFHPFLVQMFPHLSVTQVFREGRQGREGKERVCNGRGGTEGGGGGRGIAGRRTPTEDKSPLSE